MLYRAPQTPFGLLRLKMCRQYCHRYELALTTTDRVAWAAVWSGSVDVPTVGMGPGDVGGTGWVEEVQTLQGTRLSIRNSSDEETRKRLRHLAYLLDNATPLPGGYRVGLDGALSASPKMLPH